MRIACLASQEVADSTQEGGGIVALQAKRIEEQLSGHSMSRREKLILFCPGREIVLHMEKGGKINPYQV